MNWVIVLGIFLTHHHHQLLFVCLSLGPDHPPLNHGSSFRLTSWGAYRGNPTPPPQIYPSRVPDLLVLRYVTETGVLLFMPMCVQRRHSYHILS